MLLLLASTAFAHDFGPLQGTPPHLPETSNPEQRQALQLLMLPFMADHHRFATLAALAAEERSNRVDAVFVQCEAALKDGVRKGEVGYDKPARRQQKGIVADCMDAATTLATTLDVLELKGPAAELLSPAAYEPRFGVPECPALLSGVGMPAPAEPRKLAPHDGQRFASVVVLVEPSGEAIVKGRLYGDEAASRACWTAVEGRWRPATDRSGQPARSCFHHRCVFGR